MDSSFLAPLVPVVAIVAFAAVKIVRIRATRPDSLMPDVSTRLDELERGVQAIQDELAETQERLDFAERMLSNTREEKRLGG
jgi:predicted  nucleic acid-binding Zn-ribbon protein